MMIKLFAINIFAGRLTWKDFVSKGFSQNIIDKTKAELALMCDEETLADLMKED